VIFQSNMKSLAKEVEKWPLFNGRFASKLHRVADKIVDILIKLEGREDDDFNVLSMQVSGRTIRCSDILTTRTKLWM